MADTPERDTRPRGGHGPRISDEEARRRAAEQTHRTERILEEAHFHPRPPLAPIGVVLLLLVAAWLGLGTGFLYPDEARDGPIRDGSIACAMALVAIWAALMPEGKRIAAGVALVLALILLGIGIFESSTTAVLHGQHLGTGLVALLGALLCLLSPTEETRG